MVVKYLLRFIPSSSTGEVTRITPDSGVLSVSVNGNVENNIIFVENFNQNLLKSMILVRGKVCCAEKVKKNIFFDPLPENIFRSESPLRVRSSAHTSQWSPN